MQTANMRSSGLTLLPCLLMLLGYGHTRPHKVHNVLLYPNKDAWCVPEEINMVITHKGCTPLTFKNNVCVGQCYSYSTPRTNPPNQVEEKLKYCDQCKPSNSTWKEVTLDCDISFGYATFTKEVEIIEECACSACQPSQQNSGSSHHDDASLTDQYEVYDQEASREQYMEDAREKLEVEDEQLVASREELERHKDLDARNNWLQNQYKNLGGRRKHHRR